MRVPPYVVASFAFGVLGTTLTASLLPVVLLNFFLRPVPTTTMVEAEESKDEDVGDDMVVNDVDEAPPSVLSDSLDLSSCSARPPRWWLPITLCFGH